MTALGPRLELRQSVALVMTPQLRQAIKLLQLSNLDASRFVNEELERNPLLERAEAEGPAESALPSPEERVAGAAEEADSAALIHSESLPTADAAPLDHEPGDPYESLEAGEAWGSGHARGGGGDADERLIEGVAGGEESLRDHLSSQLRLAFDAPADRLIGAHLIAQLDPAGRLAAPEALAAALGTSLERLERVRRVMLHFDPVGCFARDLKECLAAQLEERNRLDPAMAALLEHLDLVARWALPELRAATGVDDTDLADMLTELRRLDPKPGTRFDRTPLQTLVPDILMQRREDGDFRLELNPETLPHVLVNHALYARISASARGKERTFLADRMSAANWLVRALAQRADTILKVAREIVATQEAFFRHGIEHLRPLTLREVGAAVSLHESTVSRVTANKYIATPRGIFELKYFFTPAIAGLDGESHSAVAVRSRIKAMINAEPAERVLSDDQIVHALKDEGIAIARRTVAKYRDALNIPNSPQRRREKRLAV